MGLLVLPSDFTGVYSVAQTSFTDLPAYILEHEENYLIKVLGLELFDLFKAQVTNQVVAAGIYKDLYDPIRMQEDGCEPEINNGMKKMLLGFIQGEYVAAQSAKNTASGTVNNKIDVAEPIGFFGTPACRNYNQSVLDAEVIQKYIFKNIDIYPDFAGTKINIWHWAS